MKQPEGPVNISEDSYLPIQSDTTALIKVGLSNDPDALKLDQLPETLRPYVGTHTNIALHVYDNKAEQWVRLTKDMLS